MNVESSPNFFKSSQIFNGKRSVPKSSFVSNLGTLFKGDCRKILAKMESNTFDLVFADPPFNLGKNYGRKVSDNMPDDEYISWCKEWVSECYRVLKDGGSIFIWNLPRWNIELAHHLRSIGAEFRHWIAVDMKNSMPIKGRLYPSHYSLLYFTKGKPKVFNRQYTPISICRHCGKELKDYGGYRDKIHQDGISLSDIWYDISPVRHKSTKTRQANELPEKLIHRIISLATNPGDLILDPFGGSGTT